MKAKIVFALACAVMLPACSGSRDADGAGHPAAPAGKSSYHFWNQKSVQPWPDRGNQRID